MAPRPVPNINRNRNILQSQPRSQQAKSLAGSSSQSKSYPEEICINHPGSTQLGKSAFDWEIYRNRKTALQYLRRNKIGVDTILETEDGNASEFVHSQIISAFGDKLCNYIEQHGSFVHTYKHYHFGAFVPALSNENVFSCSPEKPPESQDSQLPVIFSDMRYNMINQSDISILTLCSNALNNMHTNIGPRSNSVINQENTRNTNSNKLNESNLNSYKSESILKATPRLGKMKLVRLPRLSKYTLGVIVDCAYSGYIRTDMPSGGIWKVLDLADTYNMIEVIRACCAFLVKNLDKNNCIQLYHIGIKYKHPLQRSAWHNIRANFKYLLAKDMSSSSLYLNANRSQKTESKSKSNSNNNEGKSYKSSSDQATSTSDEPLIQDQNQLPKSVINILKLIDLASIKYEHFEPLLSHDKLNIDNEESVWHAIRLWCNKDIAERGRYVVNLLSCIRFPRLRTGTEFSALQIWRDRLIMQNKQAQQQLAILDRNHRDFLSCNVVNRDGYLLPCAVNPRQLRPRIPHSVLLAIGGWQQGQPTTFIESYDVNCNIWYDSNKRTLTPLAYHGVECIDNLIYICGGTDGTEILNEMFTFDPVRGDCSQKPSMRESRCYVSTAHLNGFLYAMGGHNGVQRIRSVERYDIENENWTHIQEMNVARSDASACVYDQRIYIAGGLNEFVIESSIEFYNQLDNTWTFLASMITPRTSFALILYKDSLLAIGGNDGSERLSSVEQYNFKAKAWSHHSNMREQRSTFSAALLDGSKLIVVGGYNGQTPFSHVEMYDDQQQAWVNIQKLRYDRSGLKAVVVSDLPNLSDYTYLGHNSQAYQSPSLMDL